MQTYFLNGSTNEIATYVIKPTGKVDCKQHFFRLLQALDLGLVLNLLVDQQVRINTVSFHSQVDTYEYAFEELAQKNRRSFRDNIVIEPFNEKLTTIMQTAQISCLQ
jgi:hypothetical protein